MFCDLANADDLAAITAITDAAYREYYPALGPQATAHDNGLCAIDCASQIWLATMGKVTAGLIVLQPQADHLLIYSVAVDPAHQKMGVGRTLLTWAETEARQQGFATVQLYANEKMTENTAFYQRLGYHEYKRIAYKGFQGIYMTKALQPPNRMKE